jgi:prepilin-type processing-associated H-X9-DG protein
MSWITKGTSGTYMLGEKYLNPDDYSTGLDWGDNESAYNGFDNDLYRLTYYAGESPPSHIPIQDTPGLPDYERFGSAHATGMHMAFCDGSVQMINYSIDPQTHRWLGNREDPLVIDAKGF